MTPVMDEVERVRRERSRFDRLLKAVGFGLGVAAAFHGFQTRSVEFAVAVPALVGLSVLAIRAAIRQRTLSASLRPGRNFSCPLRGLPGVTYQCDQFERGVERLLIDLAIPQHIALVPGAPPILDPAFDQARGLKASAVERALLGAELRLRTDWQMYGFAIRRGCMTVRIGAGWLTSDSILQHMVDTVSAYAARLAAPDEGLRTIAEDARHPFDAVRALATLAQRRPEMAVDVSATLREIPRGAAMARLALTGEGLFDAALERDARLAAARGLLGVECPARTRLLAYAEPPTPAEAALLVDVLESAMAALKMRALSTRVQQFIAWIVETGDDACLDWLWQRKIDGVRGAAAHFNQVNRRLLAAESGGLSLDLSEAEGGLSDARVGEVTLAAPDGPS